MGHPLGRVEFGGPDLPPRHLRDLLQQHVDQSPPGSRIDWATYYFRDRELAEALMRASDRGVSVRLVMEAKPRREGANDRVIAMLQAHGLGGGFHLYASPSDPPGRIHSKIYAFSEPDIAWVGSFNPSGDEPEDPEVIAEIGDQDRGHNLLLGIERPKLTKALRREVGRLIEPPKALKWRPSTNWRVRDGDTRLYFFPRMLSLAAEPAIARMGKRDRLRGAISHLKKSPLTRVLAFAARRGAAIDLLVHDTERRVPSGLVARLEGAGIRIRRVADAGDLPMHAKFLLVERRGRTTAWLGSYNFNDMSRLRNAEVLLSTTDAAVVEALSRRFEQIAAMAG
ncbi:MAG: phospholipase D-like domain-containing protein [Sphingomicrobium sp.]